MSFLTSINTQDLILYLIVALIVLIILLIIWVAKLESRIQKLMKGKNANSLEGSFIDMQKDIANLAEFKIDLEKYLKIVEKRISKSLQGGHSINFNAFTGNESGGKSFATAFLNEKGDGVILSSLHSRDRVSVFSKEIKNFKSEINLSNEEQSALTKAKEYCNL